MDFLNAQFGCKASDIIEQEGLTNVCASPVELLSVCFGPVPKIFTTGAVANPLFLCVKTNREEGKEMKKTYQGFR